MITPYYIGFRLLVDRLGFDPWDVHMPTLRAHLRREQTPQSRYRIGSPCRFIRTLDIIVHVWLPDAIVERHPWHATYLRSTSPRWGRTWRGWNQ